MNKKLSKINSVIWILLNIVIFTGTALTSAMAEAIEINTNSTGGDCTKIGIWNSNTNTCTLTTDINQTIEIGNDSITLDGSGHVSTGESANFGIYQNGTKNTHIENITIKGFTHGIRLDNSNNNTLINNNISNNFKSGIVINSDSGSNNNTLINNNVSNSGIGILIGSYDNNNDNKLINNNVSNNWLGIILGGNNNIVTDNNAINNYYASDIGNDIILTGNNNILTNNNANDNSGIGIHIGDTHRPSDNNILTNNNISNNYYGIKLNNSNNNIIYHNNVVFNTNQSYDDGVNSWDNGYPSGGNYWSDYTGIDSNGDGIGDTPYYINSGAGAKDRYPFMMGNGWTTPAPTTRTVCSSGCDYTIIQAAIDGANPGDTVEVRSGTYHEQVNVYKKLTLRSIGMPIVNASGSGSAITLAVDGIILEGFTATGSGNYESGIVVASNNNILIGNNANSNKYYGIYLSSSNNNTLSGNNASNNYYGIQLYSSSNNTLIGNNASSNTADGIFLSYSSNNTLTSNNASNNGLKGIGIDYSSSNILNGNNASNNHLQGIFMYSSSNNTLSGNNATSNINYGLYLYDSSNNTIYNNIFNNTKNFYNDLNTNKWNVTKTLGMNIISGSSVGGNFWANPGGTGFSQTCPDANKDGICDSIYTLDASNTDFLPLAANRKLTGTISGTVRR